MDSAGATDCAAQCAHYGAAQYAHLAAQRMQMTWTRGDGEEGVLLGAGAVHRQGEEGRG